jgi:plastocyanin
LKLAIMSALLWSTLQAQPVTVTGSVSIVREGRASKQAEDHSSAVVSLKAVSGGSASRTGAEASASRPRFQMMQHNKHFEPHLLAIPAGGVVEFPNLDPFFHNVFSMFNGNRFDLGLYESGKSHAVTFSKSGVNYIFCNIHPEMSAVVVVLDTPYFAVSDHTGEFFIVNVPPGTYTLSVWHERGKPQKPEELPREVTVSLANPSVGVIRLIDSGQLSLPHKNKYGHDYEAPAPPVVYK